MNATVKSSLVLCVATVIGCINTPVFGDSAGNEARGAVTNVFERMRSGGECEEKRILNEGTNAVQHLLPYLKDTDSRIRGIAAVFLGLIPDIRAVPPLASMLQDDDSNVRRDVIKALYRITRVLQIKDEQTVKPLLASLVAYGRDMEGSYMAFLIFGELAGKDSIPEVKRLRGKAKSVAEAKNEDGSWIGAAKTEVACLKALAKLGDPEARKEVVDLLESSDPKVRVRGIDIVHYVGKDMAPALVPMLQDERDALDVSFSRRGTSFLRVCDVAAHTLRFINRPHLELLEQMRDSHRYSKEERETIARTGSLGK